MAEETKVDKTIVDETIKVPTSVKEALAWAYKQLEGQTETPHLDAQWLLCHLLGWERYQLTLREDFLLEVLQWDHYRAQIFRRAQGEPVAYLVGYKPFMGMDFKVVPGVLIPRPDTELLVATVLEKAPQIKYFCEVGTGSGAVSISLLKALPAALGLGLEISEIAIEITRENAYSNDVHSRLEVLKSDCFSALTNQTFDAIISNPPYISKVDMAKLMRDVADYEPHLALYGGPDGLDFYRDLTRQAKQHLKPGGGLFYEIGWDQAEAVTGLLVANGYREIEVLRDLANHPRVVYGFI